MKRKIDQLIRRYSFFILIVSSCFVGCSGNGGSSSDEITPDVDYEIKQAIGASGGLVQVTDPDSPLVNVQVKIPEDAMDSDETITIQTVSLPATLPSNYIAAGEPVEFGPDGLTFDTPVEIQLTYYDKNNDGMIDRTYVSEDSLGILYYNESEGAWEDVEFSGIDKENNTATGTVDHFSIYIVYADPTDSDSEDDAEDTVIYSGEYFYGDPEIFNGEIVEKGCINREGVRCGDPYHLTVRYFDENSPEAVIDRLPTTNTGIDVPIDEDGTGVTFNAGEIFSKVLLSGSAALWTWESEFNIHTHLVNYDIYDDDEDDTILEDERIYSSIEVLESGDVRISWGFDIYTDFVVGDQIVIAFEAYYN